MDETIRKIIYNNCGIQDGATLIGYIEDILDRNNKAIEYIENDLSHATSNGKLHRKHLLHILKGSDKE